MNKQLLLLSFCLISFFTYAQNYPGKVRGFVLEDGSESPVPFANVVLQGTNYGAVTNQDGYYQINDVPAGKYTLVISFVGYEGSSQEIEVKSDRIVTSKTYLEASNEVLQDVEINVERQERETKTLTGVINLSPKEIEKFSVGGDADIMKALQVLPGVVSTGDQGGQLYIRGGAPIQNLITLDGMIVYNPFHSIGFFSVFDVDIIETADVYSAGFGAEYGSRNSAVVDVRTRTPNRSRLSGKVSASTYTSKLLLEAPLGKKQENGLSNASVMLSGKTSYLKQSSDIFYSYVDTEYDGLPFNFTDLYGKFSINSDNGSNLNLYGFSFDDEVKFGGDNSIGWNTQGAGANFRVIPATAAVIISGDVSYSSYDISAEEGNSLRTSNVKGFNGGLDFTYFIGDNDEFKFGLEAITYATNVVLTDFRGEINTLNPQNTTEFAGYAKYRYSSPKLVLEPSFRVHRYDSQAETSFEPRISAKYNINEWFRLKGAVGFYSQNLMASYSDRDVVNLFYGFLSSPSISELPDDFRGEEITSTLQKARHLLLGTEFDLSNNLTLNVEGYVKDFNQLTNLNRNKIYDESATDQPDILKTDYIVERGVAKGVDFLLKYQTRQLYLWTAYSISKVTRDDGITEYFPTFDRRHNLNFVGSYAFGKDLLWEFSTRYNFGTGFPFTPTQLFYSQKPFSVNNGEVAVAYDYTTANGELGTLYGALNSKRLPNYHRVDITLKRTFNFGDYQQLELSTGATNILNYQNIFYYDRIENKRVDQLPIMPTVAVSYKF